MAEKKKRGHKKRVALEPVGKKNGDRWKKARRQETGGKNTGTLENWRQKTGGLKTGG